MFVQESFALNTLCMYILQSKLTFIRRGLTRSFAGDTLNSGERESPQCSNISLTLNTSFRDFEIFLYYRDLVSTLNRWVPKSFFTLPPIRSLKNPILSFIALLTYLLQKENSSVKIDKKVEGGN